MSFGSYVPPTGIPNKPVASAIKYFVSVNQLSAQASEEKTERVVISQPGYLPDFLIPILPFTPFILATLLFCVAFGILVVNKIHSAKNIIVSVVLALFAAGIPTILTYVSEGSSQRANAGPEEIPRMVIVAPYTSSSALLTWHTDAARSGLVRISPVPFSLSGSKSYIANGGAAVKDHEVQIPKLIPGTTYEFDIRSGGMWYRDGERYIQFTFIL